MSNEEPVHNTREGGNSSICVHRGHDEITDYNSPRLRENQEQL